jgi:hypothetical protein
MGRPGSWGDAGRAVPGGWHVRAQLRFKLKRDDARGSPRLPGKPAAQSYSYRQCPEVLKFEGIWTVQAEADHGDVTGQVRM